MTAWFSKVRFFTKRRALILLGVLLLISGGFVFYLFQRKENCDPMLKSYKNLPTLTKSELALHDGTKLRTIYIGFKCLVYDVTSSKDSYYGEGKSYHYLVGKDSTKMLKIFGGNIIKEKYKIVGVLEN